MVGLTGEFDLANPSADFLANLSSIETILGGPFPFPYGDAVKGKTEIEFDVSSMIPTLFSLFSGSATLEISLKVSDDAGNSDSKAARLNLDGAA
jgi:hypothetical protein